MNDLNISMEAELSVETLERPKGAQRAKPAYEIWDADHHYYEPPEAFMRHLPQQYRSSFQYVTIDGRTKLSLDGRIAEYIPNPGFEVVARPGSHENFYRGRNPEGKSLREMGGKPIRSDAAFHNGAAHLAMMDDLGLHAALIFPTLAVTLEQQVGHKPDLIHALFHSLNQWVAEEYGFGNGRQFAVGAITMADAKKAVEELEFLIKAGCNAVQVRSAPAPGPFGGRSPGGAEFDPFWARCAEAKVLVCCHVGDSGYDRTYKEWTGSQPGEGAAFRKSAVRECFDIMGRPAADMISVLVCDGVFDRHPGARVAMIECGSAWAAPMMERLARTYHRVPQDFRRDPVQTVREHVSVMPFYEDSSRELGALLGMDKVLFGSDWPHPEGLGEPLDFFSDIADLTPAEQKMVMCDNLKNLLEGRW
jgi:predicted TIM-barrel fold metal-dependent hydrolase